MTTIRILDILSLKIVNMRKDTSKSVVGYRLIMMNMFSLAIQQEKSMRNAIAVHIGFMPLRLFIGFNVANRWVL